MDTTDPLQSQLAQELPAASPLQFVVSPLRGQSDPVAIRWALVASLKPLADGPVLEIGLADDGRWVIAAADGTVEDIQATGNYLPMFPLLEMPLDDARDCLCGQFRTREINPNWIRVFPFDAIAAAALSGRSRWWADLAFRWIEPLGPTDLLRAAIDLTRSTGITQQQRHRAARVWSSWQRKGQ